MVEQRFRAVYVFFSLPFKPFFLPYVCISGLDIIEGLQAHRLGKSMDHKLRNTRVHTQGVHTAARLERIR